MKKLLNVILLLIIFAVITIGCYCIYSYVIEKAENAVTQDVNEVIDLEMATDPVFTLDNYPKVDASLATQPLTNAFIKNFTGEDEISDEYLDYTNTHPGYIRLIDKEVDLIVVTEPSQEELDYAAQKNVELEVVPVVREGFVFYVNSENSVDGLTTEQIQDIYIGKIKNWSEVGGKDGEIRPFQRPKNSGSQTGMLSLVMKDKEIMEPLKEDLIDTMESIINLTADYDNGKNAIGYSYYYYATTMFDTIDSEVANKIKLLSVDGIEPSNENIKKEKYPLNTAYYIVIRKDEPQDSDVRKLRDMMLSERGQKVAEEAGYVGVK